MFVMALFFKVIVSYTENMDVSAHDCYVIISDYERSICWLPNSQGQRFSANYHPIWNWVESFSSFFDMIDLIFL